MFKMAEKGVGLVAHNDEEGKFGNLPYIGEGVAAVVLGIMQDAGLPHVGCRCVRCAAAYDEPKRMEWATCLALVDRRPGRERPGVWLIDATPDIRFQLELLAEVLGPHAMRPNRLRQPDAIFLTHAHMGHVAGLGQLGPEGMSVQNLPVYASAGLVDLLKEARLWRPMVNNLQLTALIPEQPLELAPDLRITAVPVPHRDEWGVGTFAFFVQGPAASLLYLPDIDSWEEWPAGRQWLGAADVCLVDATFYSADELGGRPPVAHPLVPDTLAFWGDLPGRLVLTHLNHTNPLLDEGSRERGVMEAAGVEIAASGRWFGLS